MPSFLHFQVLQWKRTENATFKELRTRRPKIKAILGLSKQSTTYDAIKWALDRLGIESTHVQSTEACINACVETIPGIAHSTFTPGNNLNTSVHNNTTTSSPLSKKEALCPSLVLLDLKATKELDPETVSRYKYFYIIFGNILNTCCKSNKMWYHLHFY